MRYFATLLILCLLAQPVVPAQDLSPNWSTLKSVSVGQSVAVKTTTGKSFKGLMQDVTDSALRLDDNGKSIRIQSSEVSRVYILRGHKILKGTLVGAAVGTGGGAAVGAAAGARDKGGFGPGGPGFGAAVGATLGFLLGTLAGFVIGATQHKKDLVYDASSSRH